MTSCSLFLILLSQRRVFFSGFEFHLCRRPFAGLRLRHVARTLCKCLPSGARGAQLRRCTYRRRRASGGRVLWLKSSGRLRRRLAKVWGRDSSRPGFFPSTFCEPWSRNLGTVGFYRSITSSIQLRKWIKGYISSNFMAPLMVPRLVTNIQKRSEW